ncbi:MAG: hypothetical protein OEM52_09840 [bacterium]|nr:hypothetical protein [bacterium]
MAIDRKKVIDLLSKIEPMPNAEGMIPAFGVLINQLPGSFWTGFSERLTRQVSEEFKPVAEFLLINAAHECGYHTGYGIITSEEWRAAVEPMIENIPEDVLHGAFAVLSALGWANSEIVDLKPNEYLMVRAYNYYEADIVTYGRTSKPSAYMLRGICAAFMDLAYGGSYDVTGKTGLRTFTCVQTKGIECGDDYGEFVVTRA